MMTGVSTVYHPSGYCMTCAAAGTSAAVCEILGTALLAVSIIIVRLVALLVLKV